MNKKILNAAKWSSLTEIAVKLVSPIVNMVLARVIAPEVFGIVATMTMVVSFADMFTDAGFQKYLVQHDFKSEEDKNLNANVAFWTNFFISVILCMLLFIFRSPLAILVGNPGLGNVIFIASLQLILTSFSSIQMALYRRKFDFKTLFIVRIISSLIPFVVTLPLAFLGFGYWSIIIGNLLRQLSDAIILTVKSNWTPTLRYDFKILKEMLSFSLWSLVEAFSIWLTTWADSFVIGRSLNQYYLGLYKNSTSMVNALFTIITGATTPVLFSSLSRVQHDENTFNRIFLKFQRLVSYLVLPLGVGVFMFRDLATQILLGSNWSEASDVIGIWALTGSIMIVLGNYCSELYRAKGRPKLSFIAQFFHLIFLIPACVIAASFGFWPLVYVRSFMRFQFIIVHFIIMKVIINFPIKEIFRNILPATISSIVMWMIGYFVQSIFNGMIWQFISILICSLIYIMFLLIFPSVRKELFELVRSRRRTS